MSCVCSKNPFGVSKPPSSRTMTQLLASTRFSVPVCCCVWVHMTQKPAFTEHVLQVPQNGFPGAKLWRMGAEDASTGLRSLQIGGAQEVEGCNITNTARLLIRLLTMATAFPTPYTPSFPTPTTKPLSFLDTLFTRQSRFLRL